CREDRRSRGYCDNTPLGEPCLSVSRAVIMKSGVGCRRPDKRIVRVGGCPPTRTTRSGLSDRATYSASVSASPGYRDRHHRSNIGGGFCQCCQNLFGAGACACACDPTSPELLQGECLSRGAVAVEDVLGEDRVVHLAFESGG